MSEEEFVEILRKIRNVTFDMDGTLIDSVHARAYSFVKTLKLYGVNVTEKEIEDYIGMHAIEIAKRLIMKYNLDVTPEEFAEKRSKLFYEEMVGEIRAFPCSAEILQYLKDSGYTLILATSSSPKGVPLLMGDMLKFFDYVFTAKDVERGKPMPDIYLKVKEKVGFSLVVEDAAIGILAAKRAGLPCVGVLNGKRNLIKLKEAGADFVVKDICHLFEYFKEAIG